jgi:hypothetical protein
MGEPISKWNPAGYAVPIDPGFAVGDEVLFTWEHLEKQWTFDDFAAVPQHCVHAVVEELPHEIVQDEATLPW